MKVIHVIIGLNVGGAEMMLMRLIGHHVNTANQHIVVSLTDEGILGAQLLAKGIKVYSLGMRSAFFMPLVFWRLVRLIHLVRPGIVQTWMYHSDFLGGLAARLAGSCSVVWNVRSTAIPQGMLSVTYWLVRVCAICSHFIPDRIICCAQSAKDAHIKLRYAKQKMVVIPNGYDFSTFDSGFNLRSGIRQALELADDDIVIGVVGRFDPLKDFHNFVRAAYRVAAKRGGVKFLMVGRGNEWENITLRSWLESEGLSRHFRLVGQQIDVTPYLAAMDIFCLSSAHEAFPNVVVEAMAMSLPCVVTCAGDASIILGDDGYVVPVKDSRSLGDALLRMCSLSKADREQLGYVNAMRARERYGIENIRKEYVRIYNEVAI